MAEKLNPSFSTKKRILDTALALLRDSGDAGFTMRRLAENGHMSLGNLQYHFKTRDDVLTAMVALHFETCIADLDEAMLGLRDLSTRKRASFLINLGLQHGTELTDMCRIFRELWALSSRNERVHQTMMTYYAQFSRRLAVAILGEADAQDETGKRLQSLLLPFLEGYSITGPSLPLSMEDVSAMLTDTVMSEIGAPSCKSEQGEATD